MTGVYVQPLPSDRVVQSVDAFHSQKRHTDDEVRCTERFRQIRFDEICFLAAPLTGEQKSAEMVFFVAVVDQFL